MTPESSRAPDPNDNDLCHPAGTGEALDPPARTPDLGDDAGPAELEDAGAELLEFVDVDVQNRLWLRSVVPLLQLRSQETDPSQRVQFALDQMFIAACERAARLLRSDLPPPEH